MSADTAAPLPNEWKPSFNPWVIAVSIMLATFMEVLDTSVANVSLPYIAGNLSASTDEATWVLTSYLLSNAIILPATNWLGQVFGRKRFLIGCIILFTLASALCGIAGSLGFLIIARVLQGAAGGALMPISQAVLMESFPPAKRGVAMAVFTMGIVVAPILGPIIGGWLTYNYSWRWAFFINLPVGIRILKNRNFAIGNALMLLIGALLYATIAILPLFMQNLLHYTALAAGMAMTPFGIGAFTATIIVGRISGHVSNRVLIIISCLLFGYSSFALGNINLQVAPANLFWPIIISGVGASSMYVPVATSAMGTLSQEQMGNAAGIFNLMRNIGGSIGIASITTLVTRHTQASQADLVWHMSKFNFNFQQQLAHLQTALASHTGNWAATKKSLAVLYGILQQQSSLLSYVYGFRFCVLVCLVCAALALLFKKVGKPIGPVAAH